MTEAVTQDFIDQVWAVTYRDLPWRHPDANGKFDPYRIWISEIMLQQTQVSRVIPKFENFMATFPDIKTLASSSLADVIRQWSGLGYNRRAKFIHQTAQILSTEQKGVFPADKQGLIKLPGIGANTAGAILVYAYNLPETFIETNIRTVYIHHFFSGHDRVKDSDILLLLSDSLKLVEGNYREFYWALMDYGTILKQTHGNNTRQSVTYVKQSTFEGSRRQLRGQIIKLLSESTRSIGELQSLINDERLDGVLADLEKEHMVVRSEDMFALP